MVKQNNLVIGFLDSLDEQRNVQDGFYLELNRRLRDPIQKAPIVILATMVLCSSPIIGGVRARVMVIVEGEVQVLKAPIRRIAALVSHTQLSVNITIF